MFVACCDSGRSPLNENHKFAVLLKESDEPVNVVDMPLLQVVCNLSCPITAVVVVLVAMVS